MHDTTYPPLPSLASRWFAISVPELDKSRIDSKNIAVKVSSEGGWGGTNFVGDGFSWSKWEDSRGSLLRILVRWAVGVLAPDAQPGT